MKNMIVIAILAMVAGMGHADVTIWEEDFSSPTLVVSPKIYYPADFSELEWGIVSTAAVVINGEALQISEDSGTRGVVVTIAASKFAATGQGIYSLNFDIDILRTLSVLDVEVWETTSAPGVSWYADIQGPAGVDAFLGTGTAATVSKLAEYSYVDTQEGTKEITFGYDGTLAPDITLLFALEAASAGNLQRAIFDNVSITTAIPEPATVGMLGLGALVTLLIRRFKHA